MTSLETSIQKVTVVVPTLRRPEMLALALEKLSNTRRLGFNLDVQIFLDDCPKEVTDEVEYVRDTYYPAAWLFQARPHVLAVSGCWNILGALKAGFKTGADYVVLLEEDVMAYPNFFEWHMAAWHGAQFGQGTLQFATCGRYLPKYQGQYYTNPGSCFSKNSLAAVVPHICDEFFADRRGYMDRTFGVMDEASDLDDGLIRRVIRSQQAFITYPEKPVVAHQGFHAYRLFAEYQNDGNIEHRIERLREMIAKIDPKGRYTKDFEPYQEAT